MGRRQWLHENVELTIRDTHLFLCVGHHVSRDRVRSTMIPSWTERPPLSVHPTVPLSYLMHVLRRIGKISSRVGVGDAVHRSVCPVSPAPSTEKSREEPELNSYRTRRGYAQIWGPCVQMFLDGRTVTLS